MIFYEKRFDVALYIVGTPIGNLGDMTPRAVETLSRCDFVAAEDTRVTGGLLHKFGISKPMLSYHEHNRAQSGPGIWERLLSGQEGALVTDAGMPVISDPGEELVAGCVERGIPVVLIPGPCALIGALALSGLPAGRFCFEGFLSTAAKSRHEHLNSLKAEPRTMVFYEAPHKLLSTLRDLLSALGDRRVSVSREMTKLYEETVRGTLSSLLAHFSSVPPKGEFVLVVDGAPPPPPPDVRRAESLAKAYISEGMSLRDAARRASSETGYPRRELYGLLTAQSVGGD